MSSFLVRVGIIVASTLWLASAVSLRATPQAAPKHEEKSEVTELRAKLQKISVGLSASLAPLAHSQLAVPLQAFMKELTQTLTDTEKMGNTTLALKKLHDAQAGVRSLMKDMTVRQMELMKENSSQQESLLLGVLMSRAKEPVEKQMEILKNPDFVKLPVVIAILKNKDTKTPLFQQVAKFLDEHSDKKSPTSGNSSLAHKGGKPDVSSIISALEGRVQKLEKNKKRRTEIHLEEMTHFDKAIKNATEHKNAKLAHRLERMKKKEDRKFAKEEAVSGSDLSSMKMAVDAVEHGDMKKLAGAQHALEVSMKSMQARGNGFIVFIQEAHRLEGLDCPFCVAQCIEKCSNGGNSYTTCLTTCANSGSE